MYIKLLGENENGFPLDCTVGKVYEIAGKTINGDSYFANDRGYDDFSYCPLSIYATGKWQVVDKEGSVL